LQGQRRLWRSGVSHPNFRAEAEAPAVARNQIAKPDKERRRDLVESKCRAAVNRIGGTAGVARATQRERLVRTHSHRRADVVVVVKQEAGTDVERARKGKQIQMGLGG